MVRTEDGEREEEEGEFGNPYTNNNESRKIIITIKKHLSKNQKMSKQFFFILGENSFTASSLHIVVKSSGLRKLKLFIIIMLYH